MSMRMEHISEESIEVRSGAELAVYFGRRVRTFRRARAWTQEELAQVLADAHKVALHQTTMAKLESGTRPTSVPEIYALASALGVTYEELLPPLDAGQSSTDVAAAKTAFERAQSTAKARAKEAVRARDEAVHKQLEAEALEEEAQELERKYQLVLRANSLLDRARENLPEIVDEVPDGER